MAHPDEGHRDKSIASSSVCAIPRLSVTSRIIAQALTNCATRINAMATRAQRALVYVKDAAREHYQVPLLSVPAADGKIESIHCRVAPGQPPLAIFAIGAEQA